MIYNIPYGICIINTHALIDPSQLPGHFQSEKHKSGVLTDDRSLTCNQPTLCKMSLYVHKFAGLSSGENQESSPIRTEILMETGPRTRCKACKRATDRILSRTTSKTVKKSSYAANATIRFE